nr:uncharacterized protein LOC117836942 isoform X2 [Setaria viridis]
MIANLSEKDEVLEHAVYVSNALTMKYMITKDKLSEATGELIKEVVMEDDVAWKEDWGIEVHNAVVQALVELNECKLSGRYPVHVLWNFSENRKASVARAVKHLMNLWKADMGKYMAQGDRRTRPRTVNVTKHHKLQQTAKRLTCEKRGLLCTLLVVALWPHS